MSTGYSIKKNKINNKCIIIILWSIKQMLSFTSLQ
uniref:Uncharacterized protein n=1 Tax=Anguilla anguilla TaxID=7936 RepID=A0A0E9PC99_ANGAN